MKKTLLAISMAVMTVPMVAKANTGLELSGNFGLTSNYKFRGISQTDNKPAAQGGFDLNHASGLYAGIWTSNVSSWANANGNGQEIDIYAGFATELPLGIGIDVGALKYIYPGNGADQNTLEYYFGLSYGPVAYKFSKTDELWFAFAGSKGSTYQSLSVEIPLSDAISLQAAYGSQKVKGLGNPSYQDYSVGVSYALPSDFSVSLAYVGTSGLSAAEKAASFPRTVNGKAIEMYKPSAVLTLSKSF